MSIRDRLFWEEMARNHKVSIGSRKRRPKKKLAGRLRERDRTATYQQRRDQKLGLCDE